MRFIVILLFISINSFAQERIRPVLWIGPMDNVKVYGVNITLLVFKLAKNTTINGINIDGAGIPFFLGILPMDPNDLIDSIIPARKFNVNGMSVSPLGLLHDGS